MIPRLDISFSLKRQWQFWFGEEYSPLRNEFLLNYARSGITLVLSEFCKGQNVGVMTYNCYTVASAIKNAGCNPVFLDVTNSLTLDVNDPKIRLCDAIVVTNLFGIRNDIDLISTKYPQILIVVDNAHGYGIGNEGDFTVYSINQGKCPSLGPGGILVVNNEKYINAINSYMKSCEDIKLLEQIKIFFLMLIKAFLYKPLIYEYITRKIKSLGIFSSNISTVPIKRMCSGVSRLYNSWLCNESSVLQKPFMTVIHTKNQQLIINKYSKEGIEVDTHFKKCIEWAKEFGYVDGSCPTAERLTLELVMVPTYFENNYKHNKTK